MKELTDFERNLEELKRELVRKSEGIDISIVFNRVHGHTLAYDVMLKFDGYTTIDRVSNHWLEPKLTTEVASKLLTGLFEGYFHAK